VPAFLLPSSMYPPVPVSPEDPALDEPVVRFKSLLTPLAPAFPVVPMLTSPLELPELLPLGMEMLPPVPACEAPPEMQPLNVERAFLPPLVGRTPPVSPRRAGLGLSMFPRA